MRTSAALMDPAPITVAPHPLLDVSLFLSRTTRPLGELTSPEWLQALLSSSAEAPLQSDEAVRGAVRELLRHSGYKPTGRGKPASEYLLRAAAEGTLRSINAVVDVANAVSLHSGLPISVVDLERTRGPLRIQPGAAGDTYVFNASGQTIDVGGLLCLFDQEGPCANAVKDSQRTKTGAGTTSTLTVIWGTHALPGRTGRATEWYRTLLGRLDASFEAVGVC